MIPKLSVVEEDEPQQMQPIPSPNPEIQSIASTASSKPRASPKVRILSLKRDGHSRSNSSTLNVRRYSTDSILGERLDTIGRRLSRDFENDLTASPPDLGHRFETFGKKSSEENSKFDTFSGKSGITKSADDLDRANSARERSKFDTFAGNFNNLNPNQASKQISKSQPKRKPLNTDLYNENSMYGNHTMSSIRPPSFDFYRESLHPAIYQHDRSEAILREKLHEELRVKYETQSLLKAKPPRVPSTVGRPRIRSHNPNDTLFSNRSKENLREVRSISPRNSLPVRSYSEDDDDIQDPTYATIIPKNKLSQTGNGIQLGRLSKEDLLDLSQKSESEINEFLSGNNVRHPPP